MYKCVCEFLWIFNRVHLPLQSWISWNSRNKNLQIYSVNHCKEGDFVSLPASSSPVLIQVGYSGNLIHQLHSAGRLTETVDCGQTWSQGSGGFHVCWWSWQLNRFRNALSGSAGLGISFSRNYYSGCRLGNVLYLTPMLIDPAGSGQDEWERGYRGYRIVMQIWCWIYC